MKEDNLEDVYHRELDTLLKFGALINTSLNIEDVLDNAMRWAEECQKISLPSGSSKVRILTELSLEMG